MEQTRTKRSPTEAAPQQSLTEPSEQEPRLDDEAVARDAYRRFEARGREHGRDVEDWLEAERELRRSEAIDDTEGSTE